MVTDPKLEEILALADKSGNIFLRRERGEITRIPISLATENPEELKRQFGKAMALGWRLENQEESTGRIAEHVRSTRTAEEALKGKATAFGEGLMRGFMPFPNPFISPGDRYDERLTRAVEPGLAVGGEFGGLLTPGGAGSLITKLGTKVGSAAKGAITARRYAKMGPGFTGPLAKPGLVGRAVEGVAPSAARFSAEGAAFGAMHQMNEANLGAYQDLSPSEFAQTIAGGTLFGGVAGGLMGGAFGVGGSLFSKVRDARIVRKSYANIQKALQLATGENFSKGTLEWLHGASLREIQKARPGIQRVTEKDALSYLGRISSGEVNLTKEIISEAAESITKEFSILDKLLKDPVEVATRLESKYKLFGGTQRTQLSYSARAVPRSEQVYEGIKAPLQQVRKILDDAAGGGTLKPRPPVRLPSAKGTPGYTPPKFTGNLAEGIAKKALVAYDDLHTYLFGRAGSGRAASTDTVEILHRLDVFKHRLGKIADPNKVPASNLQASLKRKYEDAYRIVKNTLEDSAVVGDSVAKTQRRINEAYSEYTNLAAIVGEGIGGKGGLRLFKKGVEKYENEIGAWENIRELDAEKIAKLMARGEEPGNPENVKNVLKFFRSFKKLDKTIQEEFPQISGKKLKEGYRMFDERPSKGLDNIVKSIEDGYERARAQQTLLSIQRHQAGIDKSTGAILRGLTGAMPLAGMYTHGIPGAIAGGVTGRAIKGALGARVFDPINMYSRLSQVSEQTMARLDKSIAKFTKAALMPARAVKFTAEKAYGAAKKSEPVSMSIMSRMAGEIAKSMAVEEPKDTEEAAILIYDYVTGLAGDPEAMAEKASSDVSGLEEDAPELAGELARTQTVGTLFLAQEMRPLMAGTDQLSLLQPGLSMESIPAENLSRISRLVAGVGDPILSVVDELSLGICTAEGAKAMRICYPDLYALTQRKIGEGLNKDQAVRPYQTETLRTRNAPRVNNDAACTLGVFFGVATTVGLQAKNMLTLQATFTATAPPPQQEPPKKKSQKALGKMTIADRTMSRSQKIEA